MGKIVGRIIKPFAIVKWAGKEISQELSGYVGNLNYIDVLDNEKVGTDTVSLSLSNSDGRFYDAWYPEEGDTLECGIGWLDDSGRRHSWMWGKFSIDDVRFSLNPDRVSIGANAKPIVRGQIDNEESATYEHTSFTTLAEEVANKIGVQALISPQARNVDYARVQQRDESQTAMLSRLAKENCIPIAFKSNQLVVGEINDSTLTIDIKQRDTLTSATLPVSSRTKNDGIIVFFYDPVNQVSGEYHSGNTDKGSKVRTLYPDGVASMEEARVYADNYMASGSESTNSNQGAKGRLTLVNTTVTTADVITLINAGKLPAIWKPVSVSTSLTGSGWTSTITVQRKS